MSANDDGLLVAEVGLAVWDAGRGRLVEPMDQPAVRSGCSRISFSRGVAPHSWGTPGGCQY